MPEDSLGALFECLGETTIGHTVFEVVKDREQPGSYPARRQRKAQSLVK